MTQNQIQSLVQQARQELQKRAQSGGVALKIDNDGYRVDDDWLYIVVSPTKPGIRAYDYVEMLSDVERSLKQQGANKVLLVPALAD